MSQVPPAGSPQVPGQPRRLAAVQRLEGVVIAQVRSVAVLEVAGRRLGVEGGPPLVPKAKVALEVVHGLRPVAQPARLVAIDGRMLQTPLSVRLRPGPGFAVWPAAQPAPSGGSAHMGAPRPMPKPAGLPGSASAATPMHHPAAEPASAARLLQAIQFARAEPATSRKPRAGEALPDRAVSAVTSMAEEMAEPLRQSQAGGWRLLLLPFGAEPAHGLKLYLGEDAMEGERHTAEAEPAAARRAVFELDLSHLGRCQLDVLCHGQRFDLIVRSERAFDAPLESEIRAAFQEVLDAASWSGAIGFHSPALLIMPGPEQPLGTPVTA